MRRSQLFITTVVIWSVLFNLMGSATSASNSEALLHQLETAVTSQDWQQAIEVVDQLIMIYAQTNPADQARLMNYREELVQLQTQPNPIPDPPSSIRIGQVQGDVVSTRTEQRTRRAANPVLIQFPGTGPIVVGSFPVSVTLPDRYGITIQFIGPVGSQPESAEVKVTLSGGGSETVERMIFAGGPVVSQSETFIFKAADVTQPRFVFIELDSKAPQRFTVSLPDRDTVLSR